MPYINKESKLIRGLIAAVLLCALILTASHNSYAADSNKLIGANIQDSQLLGYYGEGGDIVIPNTVTVIGEGAFKNNDNVTSVTIPGSVQVIAYDAFRGCTELETVTFSDPVDGAEMIIRLNAFSECPKLKNIEIPATATYVTANIFKGCTSLKEIKVHPDNEYYFTDDEGVLFGPLVVEGVPQRDNPVLTLTAYPAGREESSYTIPSTVKGHSIDRVWAGAFQNVKNLKSIVIPSNIIKLGAAAFEGTGLTSIVIPDTVKEIDAYLFENCASLTEVTLPKGVTAVPNGIFKGCTSLTTVHLPDSITSIEMYAFANCTSLSTMVLPEKLNSITLAAFEGCTNLQRVVIPPSVINFPTIEDLGACDPFEDSPSTLVVYVQKGSTAEKWAFNNIDSWGYSYVAVNDITDLTSVDPGTYYMISNKDKVKIEGKFAIGTTLKVESITSGDVYNKFAALSENSAVAVYRVSLLPESASVPDSIKLSIGLPAGFTNNSKLYTMNGSAPAMIEASILSKTLTADVDSLGYFAVIDSSVTIDTGDQTAVTSVKLNKNTADMTVGGKLQLSATVSPSTAANKTITWTSSNEVVASVDSTKGAVTANKAGTARITAESNNGKSDVCVITVTGNGSDAESDTIETNVSLSQGGLYGDDLKPAFALSLSKSKRVASVEVTFETSTSDVAVIGKNGFTAIGNVRGELKNGVYTGTAVLGYFSADQSLFDADGETVIASIVVNADKPTVKIKSVKVSGWDSKQEVKYGTVNKIDPNEVTHKGALTYDVDNNGIVELLDITAAQLYYRAGTDSDNWNEASRCDFNGDGIIDIADYIELWMNIPLN